MKIYAIKNCDTVKKALKFLDECGVEYEFHDYKKLGISRAKLEQWCDQLGWEKILKQKGSTWNKIGKPIADQLNREKAIELMLQNQSIIMRPIVESDAKIILVGYNYSEYERFFK
jgi:arsenate reductase